jgi:3-deoxy-manno-octulosonate cytidylyltransferase (CMP-KDO synthetase)
MKVVGIIPSRMGSTRFPNKPLIPIHGMPLVGHCYHRTRLALGNEATYVATCDEEIAEYVRGIGGSAVMTSSSHTRCTTRTAEAMEHIEAELGERFDLVIMVQGDEPLILPETITETLDHFSDPNIEIVNVMSRLRTYESFVDKNNVKVVVKQNNDALYYSREPIPSPWRGLENLPMYMQTGLIVFRRDTLLQFNAMEESSLEKIESVDMNRVLESGGRIRMVPTEAITIGVDIPPEIQEAEKLMDDDLKTLAQYMPR